MSLQSRASVLLILCLGLGLIGSLAFSQPPIEGSLVAEKDPLPEPDVLKGLRKQVRDKYANEFKQARTPEQKWILAQELAKQAADTQGDLETEYALSAEAIDLYATVGDILSAFQLVDDLALSFEFNPIARKFELLQQSGKEVRSSPLKRMLALVGLKLAGDAAAVEDYVSAKEIAAQSLVLARASRDNPVAKRAGAHLARWTQQLKEWEAVQKAQETLKTSPADAEANELLGRYLCLTRQQWDAGLPALVMGADAELATAAQTDLATDDKAESQSTTADTWWKLAEERRDPERTQLLQRVAYWYELALPGLGALKKTIAEQRLEVAYEAISGRNFRKLMSQPPNGMLVPGPADCSEKTYSGNMGKTFDFRRSWLIAFQFNPPNLGGGWHQVVFWGDGRPGRDPLWCRQDGGALHCVIEDCVNQRGQGITAPLSAADVGHWVDIKYVHDAVAGELELYLNNRLVRREPMAITPQPDGDMAVVLGGTNDATAQRFTGLVRGVWIGNIK